MFKKLSRIFSGDPNKKKIESLLPVVDKINSLEPQFVKLTPEELREKTTEYRSRLSKGETLNDLLPEAFAAVREAAKRALGQRHYDVQLICGINLHQGSISEMRTGEGKTLAATLPLYLNALTGKGAHLVTVNDYLARRDGRWMGTIYHLLGMSVGILQMTGSIETSSSQVAYIYDPEESSIKEELHHLRPVKRSEAYLADITYGTNSEFGFDYLRDNISMSWDQRVQRPHHYAIIDEVDNILIDEARTPLIISGPSHEDSENYIRMAQVVKGLIPEDYEILEKERTVTLTEIGISHVEELLGIPLRDPERPEDITPEQARWLGFLEQALRAQFLFHRNKEYLVQNSQVVIVDEYTGRLMPGRRWSDGLHQAVEAKEGVKVQSENVTYATITIQNYFRMYQKLAGMTGTAMTEAEEFFSIYNLEVLAIPTNLEYMALRPENDLVELTTKDDQGYRFTYYSNSQDPEKKPLYFKRKDYPDVVYRTREGKLRAIVGEIMQFYVIGRPQLVGTTSVESSDLLSERLKPEFIRRLIQVNLIRQAWMKKNNKQDDDIVSIPELEFLNIPLDNLKMPDLRKFAFNLGMESIDPSDKSNHEEILKWLGLKASDLQRLLPLLESGVPHKVLNARKHTEESLIIAGAGAFGAVTIATNMAGRGVDIKLGGEIPEETLSTINRILAKAGHTDPYNLRMQDRLLSLRKISQQEYELDNETVISFFKYMDEMASVRELGGLHVIGSERHEARRIDNQLRGRAARQGDPGSSRFYLSLEDDLMRLFGGEQVEALLSRFKIDANVPIENVLVNRLVESSQTRVEGANFDSRKHLLEYDDVLNEQRKRIYSQRDRIFTKNDLHEDVMEMLRAELGNRIKKAKTGADESWKLVAYLEDIQPPINYTWVSYPSFGLSMVMDQVIPQSSVIELKESLLRITKEAVVAENTHFVMTVQNLIDTSEQSLNEQLREKFDLLDTFLETIVDDENPDKRDLSNDISSILRIPIRLSSTQSKELLSDPLSLKKTLQETLISAYNQLFIRRLLLTVERRLNENWSSKTTELSQKPWKDIRKIILDLVTESLERRDRRLFGEDGELFLDLEANNDHLETAVHDSGELMRLLILMTQGRVLTFDDKSHQRKIKTVNRLSYFFLIANLFENQSHQEITKKVLSHLEIAEEKLKILFGNAEWDNLLTNKISLMQFEKTIMQEIKTILGEDQFVAIAKIPLEDLDGDIKEIIVNVLGAQTQNRIYRRLLLNTISDNWVEYLTKMEALRVSISMESYAQRDPLVQYKNEASKMFTELLSDVRSGVISHMFRFRPNQTVEPQMNICSISSIDVPEKPTKPTMQDKSGQKKKRKRH